MIQAGNGVLLRISRCLALPFLNLDAVVQIDLLHFPSLTDSSGGALGAVGRCTEPACKFSSIYGPSSRGKLERERGRSLSKL